MPDIRALAALADSIKLTGGMTKAMVDVRDGAKLQAKVIELQRRILEADGSALFAQTAQLEQLESIRALEKKITEVVAWEKEKERYQLTDYGGETFAYSSDLRSQEANL